MAVSYGNVTDEKVKVDSSDSSSGFLYDKLEGGTTPDIVMYVSKSATNPKKCVITGNLAIPPFSIYAAGFIEYAAVSPMDPETFVDVFGMASTDYVFLTPNTPKLPYVGSIQDDGFFFTTEDTVVSGDGVYYLVLRATQ